jgi:hypothetical protein
MDLGASLLKSADVDGYPTLKRDVLLSMAIAKCSMARAALEVQSQARRPLVLNVCMLGRVLKTAVCVWTLSVLVWGGRFGECAGVGHCRAWPLPSAAWRVPRMRSRLRQGASLC